MSTTIIRPPEKFRSIFLAGSIEMGIAENWQERLEKEFQGWVILNPRRLDWDSSWEQIKENKQFNEQVTWELSGIEHADIVVVYFDPATKSPISLMELGILSHLKPSKTIVCCPEGFYRKGNVDIVCDRYRIKNFNNLDSLIHWVKEYES